ncbi:MAG TPA: PEGA domain-containing protein [Kofleriaceae bacterium]|nr:PEGA domain-containing protein [Kofleriaceae bacterium]
MRRALVAGIALGVCTGTAGAGGTRKVDVTSEPAGASVYLNDVTTGEVCQTPCAVDVPIGVETNIILQKNGYTPDVVSVTPARKGKQKPVSSTLTAAIATLEIKDAAFKGAKIVIDDVEKGVAPQSLQVEAGPHHVAIVSKGKALFDDIVDVDASDNHEVKPVPGGGPVTTVATTSTGGGGGGGSDDELGVGVTKPVEIEKHSEPSGPSRPFIAVGGDMDVGFRQFSYDQPNNLAATESEVGAVMLGPTMEIWPIEALGGSHFRGLSLFGKVAFGINHQPVLDMQNMPLGPQTYWGNIEVDLRHRWTLGEESSISAEGGFVRDQLQFTGGSKMTRDEVPVADYRSIRIGVRAATMLGALEPFATVEGRIVLSGGELATRFASADITGARIAAGAQVRAGPVYLRAQAALTYYGWTFTNASADPMAATAAGATDVIEVLSFVIGLTH